MEGKRLGKMSKYKTRADRLKEIKDKLEEAYGELEELAGEVEEHVANMSGTNLENTEKYSTLEELSETLMGCVDDMENVINELEEVEFEQ